jgi:hypothetical protein
LYRFFLFLQILLLHPTLQQNGQSSDINKTTTDTYMYHWHWVEHSSQLRAYSILRTCPLTELYH